MSKTVNSHGMLSRLGATFGSIRPGKTGVLPWIAGIVLAGIFLIALLAPHIIPHDPLLVNARARLQGASGEHLFGTDAFGRDVFSRVIMGSRLSVLIGLSVAAISVFVGLFIGLVAGFFQWADGIIMRLMDGLMAIPGVLLAISLVALNGPSIGSVVAAIAITELPRVVRLVRSVVLSVRQEPYVEAAITLASPMPKILWQHIMPNTLPVLIVQATYVCAAAILVESSLSFLGIGVSSEIPTWGNIMADGRIYFQLKPSLIFWPGLMLSLCILSMNMLGDAALDMLDPRLKRREA